MAKLVLDWALRRGVPSAAKRDLSHYKNLFGDNTIHVSTGSWELIEHNASDANPKLLGVKEFFYNCLGGYLVASKRVGSDVVYRKGLVHFNVPENSSESLEGIMKYFAELQSNGWNTEGVLVRNFVCNSDQTGMVTRQKQNEAMAYFDSVVGKHKFSWDHKWVGESGFVITPEGQVVEKSPFRESILGKLSPELLKELDEQFALEFAGARNFTDKLAVQRKYADIYKQFEGETKSK